MFLSGLKCLRRLERQVKFARNRFCKIKPVAVITVIIMISLESQTGKSRIGNSKICARLVAVFVTRD